MMVVFVVSGAVLTSLGLYEPSGGGRGGGGHPVSNFGYVVTQGVLQKLQAEGLFGLFSGIFSWPAVSSAPPSFSGTASALLFKPRGVSVSSAVQGRD